MGYEPLEQHADCATKHKASLNPLADHTNERQLGQTPAAL
jgi:hypothetical protein